MRMRFAGIWGRCKAVGRVFLKDTRSALVGAVVGSTITFIGTLLAHQPEKQIVFGVNEDGIGQPKSQFSMPEVKKEGLVLQFHPTELKNVYVCEHKIIRGSSWTNVVLEYLSQYSMCFNVIETADNTYTVFPNKWSGQLASIPKGESVEFFCKCSGFNK